MPPNYIIRLYFNNRDKYYEKYLPILPSYSLTVEFDDIYGKHHKNTHKLNLTRAFFVGDESDSQYHSLYRIKESLNNINGKIKNQTIRRNINRENNKSGKK